MSYYSNSNYPPTTNTAFGIADEMADFISKHSAICLFIGTIVWFIIMMLIKSDLWVSWIFVSPILAWGSTSLLLVIGFLEWVIWKVHQIIRHILSR